MSKFVRKMTILAKAEAVYGTNSLPTAGLNAIRAFDVTAVPVEGDEIENNYIQPHFGATPTTQVTQYKSLSFSVPFSGVSALGAMPGVAELIRMCSTSVTNEVGVSTLFDPITENPESGSLLFNIDGILHTSLGVRGTVTMEASAKAAPAWKFELKGSFVPLVDAPLPTGVVYTKFLNPLGVNKANTTLLVDGLAVEANAFSFAMGLDVVKEDLINVDSVDITGRKSTGSVTFRNTAVAVRDWVGMGLARAQVPIAFRHGLLATNTVKFTAARAEIGKPSYSDSSGVQMITLPLRFIPSDAGNDEWQFEI